MEKKITVRGLTLFYIALYTMCVLVLASLDKPMPTGEWDDYSLPSISIMYQHNIGIDDADVAKFKEVFPEWSEYISKDKLSGFNNKAGDAISFYFPVYSAAAIPFIALLQAANLPARYAYAYTNVLCLAALLLTVYYFVRENDKRTLLLVVLLSINPIIFYIEWISAEVFIYSMIGIAMVFWYRHAYKRAALFISLAGMLNPTIMIVGILMIVDYFYEMLHTDKSTRYAEIILQNAKDIILFGLCFSISLIPMVYNYVNTGHINLTAAYENFTVSKESIFQRFFAYLFDLNLGFLPYFPILLVSSIVLIPIAVVKKNWTYLLFQTAFYGNVVLYSIMIHINSGMSGIARYNAWNAALLIFSVWCCYDKMIKNKAAMIMVKTGLLLTPVILMAIITIYGPVKANVYSCREMTPIASFVLDHFPQLYNPLPSTFCSRIKHVDGGYSYDTPLVYENGERKVKKIYAASKDIEALNSMLCAFEENDEAWLMDQINHLGIKPSYISISCREIQRRYVDYSLGQEILFFSDQYNADKYVLKGISAKEETFSWTDGKELLLGFMLDDDKLEPLHFHMDIIGLVNTAQEVKVRVNGVEIYSTTLENGDNSLDFDIPALDSHTLKISLELPDAISPKELGVSSDKRELGLMIHKIVITQIE